MNGGEIKFSCSPSDAALMYESAILIGFTSARAGDIELWFKWIGTFPERTKL